MTTPVDSAPTVFVVDDDPSVRRGLSRLIRSLSWKAETFDSAAAYLKRAPFEGNGCIVLDIRMPGISGPELQSRLSEQGYSLPIVFLTGHGDVPASVEAMKLGAVDFLQKPVDENDLVRAIETALARDRDERPRYERRSAVLERLDRLTPREREVLEHVICGRLNKQIAVSLGIALKTVKIHRGRVMEKMGVGSLAELVRVCELAGITPHSSQDPDRTV
jgi:FixJ family two-component response regulator